MRKRMQGKGGGLPPMHENSVSSARGASGTSHYDPVAWNEFFDEKVLVETDYGMEFNVYRKGDSSLPAILFVHGGGFTGLTWSHFVKSITSQSKVQCICPDLRGHGLSTPYPTSDSSSNSNFYSLDNFTKDLTSIMSQMPGFKNVESPPKICIFGHSMGGAIVSHVANSPEFYQVACIALFDVIEGSALAALPSMEGVIKARPKYFADEQAAVKWALQTNYIKNVDSARVSMPSQVKKVEETIENDENGQNAENPQNKYTWRTDLLKTRPFWDEWFRGMDKKFLETSCGPKLVLVTDPSNLDKEMTIAQMQGKFQIQMLPQSGHAVHEDQPVQIATKITDYLKRFRIAEPVAGGFGSDARGKSGLVFKSYCS
jgi:protein phosphatase methylesterase 1